MGETVEPADVVVEVVLVVFEEVVVDVVLFELVVVEVVLTALLVVDVVLIELVVVVVDAVLRTAAHTPLLDEAALITCFM